MSAEQVRRLREDLAAAVAERDRLRAVVEDVRAGLPTRRFAELEAERDRLRAVVDAAQAFRQLDFDKQQWSLAQMVDAQRALFDALDQLDASPTGEGT